MIKPNNAKNTTQTAVVINIILTLKPKSTNLTEHNNIRTGQGCDEVAGFEGPHEYFEGVEGAAAHHLVGARHAVQLLQRVGRRLRVGRGVHRTERLVPVSIAIKWLVFNGFTCCPFNKQVEHPSN